MEEMIDWLFLRSRSSGRFLRIGLCNLSKNLAVTSKFWAPEKWHWGPTNIRRHLTKCFATATWRPGSFYRCLWTRVPDNASIFLMCGASGTWRRTLLAGMGLVIEQFFSMRLCYVRHINNYHVYALLLYIGHAGRSVQSGVTSKRGMTIWWVNHPTSGTGEIPGICYTHSLFSLNCAFFTDIMNTPWILVCFFP